jgi:peptide/nickel transport system permease protein
MVGLAILLLLIVAAILAPYIATHDPIEVAPTARLLPPSSEHLLGTDRLGRDVFSRVIYGTRISLRVGLIAVGLALVFGLSLGLVSGYYGGTADLLITLLLDMILAFPSLLLALLIIAALGVGLGNAMLALGVAGIPTYARVVRSSTLAAKENLYVDAARVVGCRAGRIVVFHLLPNVASPLIVVATLGLGQTILAAAGLSFLGLGAQPPTPEWGTILGDGRQVLYQAWWVATFPGLAIVVAVLAINLLGDGLREALDPHLWE